MTDVQEQALESENNGNGGYVETLEERRRRDRASVPAVPGKGLTPANFADYITMAQGICKPDNISLKPELRNNIAVVIGLLEIAERADMSITMLNQHTYVIKGVLCFDALVFHALAE